MVRATVIGMHNMLLVHTVLISGQLFDISGLAVQVLAVIPLAGIKDVVRHEHNLVTMCTKVRTTSSDCRELVINVPRIA